MSRRPSRPLRPFPPPLPILKQVQDARRGLQVQDERNEYPSQSQPPLPHPPLSAIVNPVKRETGPEVRKDDFWRNHQFLAPSVG